MAELRGGDADSLMLLAQRLWELEDLASFRAELPTRLRELIDCEIASYNEIGPRPEDVFVSADPEPALELEGQFEMFSKFALQNPLAAHYARTGDQSALRMSDFISARRLHTLDLYDLVYRELGVESQLAFTLPAPGHLIGVTVSRDGRDFTERELALLEASRRTIAGAYRNVHERAQLEVIRRSLDLDEGPHSILLVEASGVLVAAHDRAERLLREISGEDAGSALRDWAGSCRRREEPAEALTLGTRAGELQARYVGGSDGNLDAILVRRAPVCESHTLRTLGLTRRQADVLYLVWLGYANAQIALELDISEHTVRHHLEDIYGRLDVSSRGEAAQLATRTLLPVGAQAPRQW
jgi:DNA-binding CsgD family transcriptional regulator